MPPILKFKTNFHYTNRNADQIHLLNWNRFLFKNSFFPSVIKKWNKLDRNLTKTESFKIFKKFILSLNNHHPAVSKTAVGNCFFTTINYDKFQQRILSRKSLIYN